MPTALARAGGSSSAKKPKTPKVIDASAKPMRHKNNVPGIKNQPKAGIASKVGPKSVAGGAGASSIQGDLNSSERRAQTISSDAANNNQPTNAQSNARGRPSGNQPRGTG